MVVLDRRTNTTTSATQIDTSSSPVDDEIFGKGLVKVKAKALHTLDDFADQVSAIQKKKTEIENKIHHAKTEGEISKIMREMRSYL